VTDTSTATATDAEILAVLDERVAAHAARDAQRMIATCTDDAVRYTLAPPLQQGPGTPYGTRRACRRGWQPSMAPCSSSTATRS
jgi:ketosteroid isomerase-like protein